MRLMEHIRYEPIGVVHSPFPEPEGTPIQATGAEGVPGSVEVFPRFAKGLKDLDGFSHIVLLYHCHRAGPPALEVTPVLDDVPRGVFATRAPARPNAIGLSVVRLVGIEGSTLRVRDVDVVDGTPLLDIKPYVPAFDTRVATRIGWLRGRSDRLPHTTDDGRFAG
jgi:tRNA-Thr(GGU) m(6)t(6)A37 methyltransferase TsaA